MVTQTVKAELVAAGATLSPKLAADEQWKKYLTYAVRRDMVNTHEQVSILAYGWEAGSRREVW